MPEKKEISAGELVKDLRDGMTALELMNKYALTPVQLERIFLQLERVAAKPSKLYGRGPSEDDRLTEKRIRVLPRHKVAAPVRLHDLSHREINGVVRDITEKGIGIEGYKARVDETKTFVVLANEFFAVSSFQLEAKCCWAKAVPDTRQHVAGFQIINISESNLRELRRFIDCIARAEQAARTSPLSVPLERTSLQKEPSGEAWVCPFCKMPQSKAFDECPQCGIIGSKYMQRLEKTKTAVLSLLEQKVSLEKPPEVGKEQFVHRSIYVSANLWRELETLEGNVNEHVTKALSSYLLRAKVGRLKR